MSRHRFGAFQVGSVCITYFLGWVGIYLILSIYIWSCLDSRLPSGLRLSSLSSRWCYISAGSLTLSRTDGSSSSRSLFSASFAVDMYPLRPALHERRSLRLRASLRELAEEAADRVLMIVNAYSLRKVDINGMGMGGDLLRDGLEQFRLVCLHLYERLTMAGRLYFCWLCLRSGSMHISLVGWMRSNASGLTARS